MDITADELVARRARRQLGLITRAQGEALGLTSMQMRHRVRTGRWVRLSSGVYRVGGVPESPEQILLASCLHSSSAAVAHGLSVLALFHARAHPPKPRLLLPPTASARHPLAVVHRGTLHPSDRTSVGPIPSTTPARAIVDAASSLDEGQLRDTLAVLCTATGNRFPVVTAQRVAAALERSAEGSGREGAERLRAVLAPWLRGLVPDSPGEARLLRRLAEWGFPEPVTQHVVLDEDGAFVARLDVAWPDFRAAVEYDPPVTHPPTQLAADEVRHLRLEALGWWISHADADDLRPSADRLHHELLWALGAARR